MNKKPPYYGTLIQTIGCSEWHCTDLTVSFDAWGEIQVDDLLLTATCPIGTVTAPPGFTCEYTQDGYDMWWWFVAPDTDVSAFKFYTTKPQLWAVMMIHLRGDYDTPPISATAQYTPIMGSSEWHLSLGE